MKKLELNDVDLQKWFMIYEPETRKNGIIL